MKKIAVLLTVFNRKEHTLRCLDNLFRQEIPDGYSINVYLTDDGCTDGTAQAVLERFSEKVKVIQGDGNLFWNRGMWTAWDCAAKDYDYDYYLWLNDDTYLFDDAVSNILASSNRYGNEAIIAGATVDTETHKTLTYGGRLKDSIAPCNGQDVDVDHFNGNIVLVPVSAYKVLGNLDYFFTHSKGDFDYGMRARKAGIRILQCGTALGECDVHPEMDKWCDPRVPLPKRWKLMKRPNGMPPKESFHLNKRHLGFWWGVGVYCAIILRCIFPRLWVLKEKAARNKSAVREMP